MKVYFIRHGQSENNLKGLWTGWQDAKLTEKGIEDAKLAGEVIKGVKFDKVYSSDLSRARDTAKAAIQGCEPCEIMLLREVDVGNIAGKPFAALSDEERALIPTYGYSRLGGETREEYRGRIEEFCRMIEPLDCENIAVFTHAGVLRTMLSIVTGVNIPNPKLACNNCAVAIFEYIDEKWRVYSWINVT